MARTNHYLPSSNANIFGGGTVYPIRTASGVYYAVYIEGQTLDVVFRKSTNGITWSDPTVIFAGSATAIATWYDRWSGISAGLIHVAYQESGTDDTLYRTVDTENSDTLSTETSIFAGATTAAGGALSITRARGGNVFTLTRNLPLSVDAGSYSVSGQDVTLTHAWLLNVDAGSYAVTGQDVALLHGWVVSVDAGSYSVTGQDVTLEHRFYLRPDADVSDGTWTDQAGGSDLFAAIDEATFDDADYIKSASNPVNDTCVVSLGDPGKTPVQPARVKYRYWREGETGAIELRVRLLEGASQIAVWTHSGISATHTTVEQELSGAEFAAITDFTNLRLEFRGNAS